MRTAMILAAACAATNFAQGQDIDPDDVPPVLAQPIFETADANFDTCGVGVVEGLNPNGDGFLSVRTGPGTEYDRLAKLMNGDRVWIFETVGDWHGVIYGVDAIECSPIAETRVLYRFGARHGWVHGNWIKPLAG